MVDKIAEIISNRIIAVNGQGEDKEIYTYGLQILLNTLLSIGVVFDANKGKFGSKSTKKVKVVRNQSVATGFLKGKLAALKPKRAGYKLVGWYYIDKDNKKVKVKNSTKIKDKNIVIYAKWKKK